MSRSRTCGALALALVSTLAPHSGSGPSTAAAQHARPAHQCQLTGNHVSGVVSVELGGGNHAELQLVDVNATVQMTPSLADVTVHVTAPLSFSGHLVTGDLGAPAAFVPRTYRAHGRGLRLDGNVPFEITLASDPSHARARVPSPFSNGVISVPLPCSALRAGAPRTDMRPPEPEARLHYIAIAPGTHILSGAGTGYELARVERMDSSRAAVAFAGSIGETRAGFVRVSLRNAPIQLDGFVPEGTVVALESAAAPMTDLAAPTPTLESLAGMPRVRLPVGTAVYATPSAAQSWASVTAPLDVYLRTQVAGERSAVVLSAERLGTLACRFDGVAGRPFCGGARELPRLGLRTCSADGCVDVAYVTPP
ncbi:MAG: hypothetical protein KC593_13150 [Myxococcales bacterium]|nr:hypothetical protein [Myxococcales bacterium]MCB9629821.1 hypothetical protein [Sandaracinaceae bacterium]